MLCRASLASSALSIGGGGGFSMLICVELCAVKPRESVQVAFTVIGPGGSPAVLRVAELPLPETVPALEVQLATETGTLSGLLQMAERLTLPPATRLVGLADSDRVGGFLGGSGLIV